MNGAGRVADDCEPGLHISEDDSAHPDDCTSANAQGPCRGALANERPGADIRPVTDVDMAIAADARRKGDEITDPGIMFDDRGNIGMKMPPNSDVTGEDDLW